MICLTSAHGAPGVTTTALVLSAAWPGSVVLETDPSGGVIAARHDVGVEPGLTGLAAALRHGPAEVDVDDHAQRLSGGVRVVTAPTSPDRVSAALRRFATPEVAHMLGDLADPLIVDCGRALPTVPAHPLLAAADLVVWVCRSDLAELAVLRNRLGEAGGDRVVLVGDDPWGVDEVSTVLGGVPVTAVPCDPKAAAVVTAGAPRRRMRRSSLRPAIGRLAEVLAGDLAAGRESPGVRDGALDDAPVEVVG